MKLLAVETATEACSAALLVDGEMRSRYEVAPRQHTELILPMCDALISEAGIQVSQLDAVAFGRGPGSFTGLRIAAGVAQGIAFAWDLPVVPVSTLAVMAQEAIQQSRKPSVLTAIDARMQEVYWGVYQGDASGLAVCVGEETVIKPQSIPQLSKDKWYGVGSGWKVYHETITQSVGAERLAGYDGDLLPKAQFIVPLAQSAYSKGQTVAAEHALPIYLRDEVAKKRSEPSTPVTGIRR